MTAKTISEELWEISNYARDSVDTHRCTGTDCQGCALGRIQMELGKIASRLEAAPELAEVERALRDGPPCGWVVCQANYNSAADAIAHAQGRLSDGNPPTS